METKKCNKCNQVKDVNSFYFVKRRNSYHGSCKICVQSSKKKITKLYKPTIFNDLEGEIWKTIPKTNNMYQASNMGRIRSLDRYIIDVNNFKSFKRGTILKAYVKKNDNNEKYYSLTICINNKKKTLNVHTLVFSAFNGFSPTINSKKTVDHKDNNKLNNNIDNLQLITSRENSSKDRKNKTSKYTGVSFRKDTNKWQAQITINKKCVKIISSKSEELCYKAYEIALKNTDNYNGNNVEFRKIIKKYLYV